jgi:hypothetical protein
MPTLNERTSRIDNVSKMMHIQCMEAAYYLQKKLDIWTDLTFVDFQSLPKDLT